MKKQRPTPGELWRVTESIWPIPRLLDKKAHRVREQLYAGDVILVLRTTSSELFHTPQAFFVDLLVDELVRVYGPVTIEEWHQDFTKVTTKRVEND